MFIYHLNGIIHLCKERERAFRKMIVMLKTGIALTSQPLWEGAVSNERIS